MAAAHVINETERLLQEYEQICWLLERIVGIKPRKTKKDITPLDMQRHRTLLIGYCKTHDMSTQPLELQQWWNANS